MSYAIDALLQLREHAISQIATFNNQIADIDALLDAANVERPGTVLEKQEGSGNAPAPTPFQPPAPQSPQFNHAHWAGDDAGELRYDNGGSLPSAVIPPTPVATTTGDAMTPEEIQEARERESRPEPGPAVPPSSSPVVTAQENAQPRPWEQQAAEDAQPPAPAEPKKSGRRTNEEIAADHGVSLEDVKTWLGKGQRVTAAKIAEFAQLHPGAVALPGGAEQPSLIQEAAPSQTLAQDALPVAAPTPPPTPAAEPVRPPEPTAEVPPESDWDDADDAPVVGATPQAPAAPSAGWDPFSGTGSTEKPPF